MANKIQVRRGTASAWTSANTLLSQGEIGFETDTNKFKIGDGVNHWADLDYFVGSTNIGASLEDYIPLTALGAADGVAQLNSDRKSTRLNSSHSQQSRMPSSA